MKAWIVGLNFRRSKRAARYNAGELRLRLGDYCVVKTDHGVEVARVAANPMLLPAERVKGNPPRVLRRASEEDVARYRELEAEEERARRAAQEQIRALGLPMKVSQVECHFEENRAALYFTARERVDFRSLVRKLSDQLGMRIEMRQLGARDEARMMNGCGSCGRDLCISAWLPEFRLISIRMAKVQDLALNPSKLSGMCGKLKCCLSYEFKEYEGVARRMPKLGKRVSDCAGCSGCVAKRDLLEETLVIQADDGQRVTATLKEYEESRLRSDG
ncbi:MAG: stage 0 sporulation protein [Candidatus Tectomicrobia bacterium]|nr:stage 0 sporulation protein [Candidatus Tectomicrobia bacterium]